MTKEPLVLSAISSNSLPSIPNGNKKILDYIHKRDSVMKTEKKRAKLIKKLQFKKHSNHFLAKTI